MGTSTSDLVKSSLAPVVRGVVKEVVGHQPSSKTSVWSEGRRKRIALAEWTPGCVSCARGFWIEEEVTARAWCQGKRSAPTKSPQQQAVVSAYD